MPFISAAELLHTRASSDFDVRVHRVPHVAHLNCIIVESKRRIYRSK